MVSNFLVQAINGEDITVYGAGSQTLLLFFVDDLVDGLIRLMNQEETVGPVNIGNPGEFTIKQVRAPPLFDRAPPLADADRCCGR